jgi:hypothetical protein
MGKHLVDGIRADASLAGNLATRRLSPESDVGSSTIAPSRYTYEGSLPGVPEILRR